MPIISAPTGRASAASSVRRSSRATTLEDRPAQARRHRALRAGETRRSDRWPTVLRAPELGAAIVGQNDDGPIPVVYRRAGDDNLLVEYGPMELDIALRLRVHVLAQALEAEKLAGLVDLTPGIRSLQIHYDGTTLSRHKLLDVLRRIERELPPVDEMRVPSRTVHLPLSWRDPEAELAMRKYQELVRADAPWCPSNVEFIRRINGFAARTMSAALCSMRTILCSVSATSIRRTGRDATRSAAPIGDHQVQPGADLDAGERGRDRRRLYVHLRHGRAGRLPTLRPHHPVWNSWRTTHVFKPGHPWLLRFFDKIRFFRSTPTNCARPAPHSRMAIRHQDRGGRVLLRRLRGIAEARPSIAAFKATQQAAFDADASAGAR